ncbi:TIGR02996 domain-containing protein [Zavarzinella formosa]|uniref:TIGR02996 domain-containing protein n=1 Tax=Zavarzinella formosa TaxID=360055 RepID=UPI0002E28A27|nr:TIGR02996 domain-containing protein [Zavarzinella formosa]
MDEEAAFTETILAAPRDDAPRLVFADWLEERDDPRGEWLRVTVRLQRLVWNIAPVEMRARHQWVREVARLRHRLRELMTVVPEAWAIRMQAGHIEHCNILDGDCPREWLRLPESDRPDRRHCVGCGRFVRYCRSADEVNQAVIERQPVVRSLVL